MSVVLASERSKLTGAPLTDRVRRICLSQASVTGWLCHAEATWFGGEKQWRVSVSDYHHDDRVGVVLNAAIDVQVDLIDVDPPRYFRRSEIGRASCRERVYGRV